MSEAINTAGLGKITAMCACYTKNTLNGRGYDKIYQRILAHEDYRFEEMMRRGGILCEFGHPNQYTADFERTETDPQNACALITKIEEREHGKIYAEATILDTPAGRIFKAIQPFYKFGFSSRGSYEADEYGGEGPDGWNQDSYVFKGFDIVALPANEGSEITALESVNSKSKKRPKFKSAREALDLQNIADAASVDPKEVSAELDKLFARDGSLAPVEFVDAREFAGADDAHTTDESTPDGKSDNLVLDLNKALLDKSELEQKVQKLLFEKAQSEAAVITLQKQVEDLTQLRADAESKIAFYEENKKEIQELLDRLLETHDSAMQQADAQLNEEKEKSKSLAAQVMDLQQQVKDATDEAALLYGQAEKQEQAQEDAAKAQQQAKSLASSVESLRRQLAQEQEARKAAELRVAEEEKKTSSYRAVAIAAREELVKTYATVYSVDPKAIAKKIGNSSDVSKIKAVAESISKDIVRFSGYVGAPVVVQKPAAPKTPFAINDEVDRELLEALRKEGLAD